MPPLLVRHSWMMSKLLACYSPLMPLLLVSRSLLTALTLKCPYSRVALPLKHYFLQVPLPPRNLFPRMLLPLESPYTRVPLPLGFPFPRVRVLLLRPFPRVPLPLEFPFPRVRVLLLRPFPRVPLPLECPFPRVPLRLEFPFPPLPMPLEGPFPRVPLLLLRSFPPVPLRCLLRSPMLLCGRQMTLIPRRPDLLLFWCSRTQLSARWILVCTLRRHMPLPLSVECWWARRTGGRPIVIQERIVLLPYQFLPLLPGPNWLLPSLQSIMTTWRSPHMSLGHSRMTRPIFLGSAQPLPGWFPGTATCSYSGEGQAWPFVSGRPAYSSGCAFYSAWGKGDPDRWHNLWMPIDLDWRPKTQDEAIYENPGAGKPHWSWHGSCIFGRFKLDLVVLLLSLVYV